MRIFFSLNICYCCSVELMIACKSVKDQFLFDLIFFLLLLHVFLFSSAQMSNDQLLQVFSETLSHFHGKQHSDVTDRSDRRG